ncbi:zeta toxin family protein (plasmid) [Xylella taiwanensis]|uniref:Zeta toxin family protein n=1 Tax=Xylella taiwanensis TaxID=1444770 RepID=A0ABS8TVN6_9GAMM|nr:zeta toxin family protein [Xylella taiwanensis]MCD8459802.1 zeta toxin family protein [Xylella taiwanensis]MCD8474192.1 zeta toxin family protein [Xylella taiwanensis]UFN08031.1 zeta toxin family protein [Xylella taiwanensis]UFN10324.1 zeta toxin family protein [Xylella taiwanensis]UFN12612.1 zeta toxin family protein [Xylella taiwanensis]
MVDYKPLTDSEVMDTAVAYYTERQAKSLAKERPTIVFVGGQPGAGKSIASSIVKAELAMQGGYVHIDADRMRERIRVGDSTPTSEETQADAGRLVTALRDQAIQGRRNIVEEGTFRNPESAEKFVQALLENGYNVELFAVATSGEESLLGIYQRYELQHVAGVPNPRFVSEKYHEEAMQGFESTLARTAVQFDRVRVADRSGAVLYDSVIQSNKQLNALEALAAGRKLTDTKLAEVTKAWSAVDAIAHQRNALSSYLDAVSGHLHRLEEMQKERIHCHAMDQVEANAAMLARDARYAHHTRGELTKAAYFRGFHEKKSEFEGVAPDFAKYDATVASRQTLRQLPDVADLERQVMPAIHRINDGNSL